MSITITFSAVYDNEESASDTVKMKEVALTMDAAEDAQHYRITDMYLQFLRGMGYTIDTAADLG